MLAIEITFLAGRYIATGVADRTSPEWPPHPARLFSALVDAWAAGGCEPTERAALLWLETAGPPAISASAAAVRDAPTVYVPVNDATVLGDYSKLSRDLEAAEAALGEARLAAQGEASKRATTAVTRAAKAVEKVRAQVTRVAAGGRADGLEVLPQERPRQPRWFPSVTPSEPVVHFVWSDAVWPEESVGDEVRSALDELAGRVARLGHSSSLVSCRIVEQSPEPTFLPDREGPEVFRGVAPGQLDALVEAHEHHRGAEPRVLSSVVSRYRAVAGSVAVAAPSVPLLGGDWFVFEQVGGAALPATATVEVAAALRNALMWHGDQPPHAVLSGHDASGGPAKEAHAAYLALPFVGHRHATGTLLGVAVALPTACPHDSRRAALRAIGRWEAAQPNRLRLTLGRAGVLELRRVVGEPTRANLRPSTWCRPSDEWATTTPIVLDRHPGDLRSKNPTKARRAHDAALAAIARGCERSGLPAPERVELASAPFAGVPPARGFPPFGSGPRRSGPRRAHVHAVVRFGQAVRGPVLLGAGRFYGMGLLRPVGRG